MKSKTQIELLPITRCLGAYSQVDAESTVTCYPSYPNPPPIEGSTTARPLLEAGVVHRNTLRSLPTVDTLSLSQPLPWQLITTKQAAQLLHVDPACLTVWKYRGLGPEPELSYFRGSVQTYRIDQLAAWLAHRHGQTYDQDAAWAEALKRLVHNPEGEVRALVKRWVELLGPTHAAPPGCRWRPGGFEAYVGSL